MPWGWASRPAPLVGRGMISSKLGDEPVFKEHGAFSLDASTWLDPPERAHNVEDQLSHVEASAQGDASARPTCAICLSSYENEEVVRG